MDLTLEELDSIEAPSEEISTQEGIGIALLAFGGGFLVGALVGFAVVAT